jgi:hypothetical protein
MDYVVTRKNHAHEEVMRTQKRLVHEQKVYDEIMKQLIDNNYSFTSEQLKKISFTNGQ